MMLGQSNNIPMNWGRMRQERSTAALLLFCSPSWSVETDCSGLDQILLRCATLAEPLRLLPSSHMYELNCKCPQVALRGITVSFFLPNLSSFLKYNKQ